MEFIRCKPRKAKTFFFTEEIEDLRSLFPCIEFNQNGEILIVSCTGDSVQDLKIENEILKRGGTLI